MPPKTQQAQKSPRRPQTVKEELATPNKTSGKTPKQSSSTPKVTITTPKTKTPKSEPKSESKPAAASSSKESTPKRKSARKTKVEKEQVHGVLKKESIRKTAKISGCTRIAADVYEKARAIFDSQLAELLNRASLITLHTKKKQITFQVVNKCAKDLWDINIYSGTNADDVKAMSSKEDDDYEPSDASSDE